MKLMKLRQPITIRRVLILALVLFVVAICAGVLVQTTYRHYGRLVSTDINELEPANVAVVFGAGLVANSTRPSDMLYDRLATAANLYAAGKTKSILVSGDNRFAHYSEPDVMRQTLVEEFGIPEVDIYTDYAGRRTYDTCARAYELWGVRHAILVTQDYHLPRALMTCAALGIASQGASGSLRQYRGIQKFTAREIVAILMAYVDVYIWPPKHLGGPKEAHIDE